MPGHLFVVRGDLTRLACDAWLLPTGRTLQIRPEWLRTAPDAFVAMGKARNGQRNIPRGERVTRYYESVIGTSPEWQASTERTFRMPENLWQVPQDSPQPWITNVVVNPGWSTEKRARWCAESAAEFVRAASKALVGWPPANNRHWHLLALPVVGTGAGGGWDVAGSIIDRLIPSLLSVLAEIDQAVDVALVTHSSEQFAAAQQARYRLVSDGGSDPWSGLPSRLRTQGQKLALHARAGRLVLFLGAGVSVSAGLPTWNGLIERLAETAEMTDDEMSALKQLSVLDQARVIQDRLERSADGQINKEALSDAIVRETQQDRYGLTHALLAGLPVSESVTTNYDTLFETASNDAGYVTAALPYESVAESRRWLLKMHGCVNHKADIVLTREDFLRYASNRGALAGIVQALLITRHMAFIGFSLTDDNFLRIADEVRRVIRRVDAAQTKGKGQPFGTALLLSHGQLLPSLWRDDLTCVSIADAPPAHDATEPERAAAMRKAATDLEILLDYILAESTQHVSHLLNTRYEQVLSREEKELRDALQKLRRVATKRPAMKELPAWQPVERMLEALGAPPEKPQS